MGTLRLPVDGWNNKNSETDRSNQVEFQTTHASCLQRLLLHMGNVICSGHQVMLEVDHCCCPGIIASSEEFQNLAALTLRHCPVCLRFCTIFPHLMLLDNFDQSIHQGRLRWVASLGILIPFLVSVKEMSDCLLPASKQCCPQPGVIILSRIFLPTDLECHPFAEPSRNHACAQETRSCCVCVMWVCHNHILMLVHCS